MIEPRSLDVSAGSQHIYIYYGFENEIREQKKNTKLWKIHGCNWDDLSYLIDQFAYGIVGESIRIFFSEDGLVLNRMNVVRIDVGDVPFMD